MPGICQCSKVGWWAVLEVWWRVLAPRVSWWGDRTRGRLSEGASMGIRGLSQILLRARGIGAMEIFRFLEVDVLDEEGDIGEVLDNSLSLLPVVYVNLLPPHVD
jgi:hypothetical protein